MKTRTTTFTLVFGSLLALLLNVRPTRADEAGMRVLLKTEEAMRAIPSYRATMTLTDDRGTNSTIIEYARPDRRRLSMRSGKIEWILIGKTSYMKAGGRWQKSPMDMGGQIEKMSPELQKEMLHNATIKQVGTDNVDGRPTVIYEVVHNDKSLHSRTKYWVSPGDNLIHKMEGTTDMAGIKVLGKSVGGKSTLRAVFDYKANVRIVPPM